MTGWVAHDQSILHFGACRRHEELPAIQDLGLSLKPVLDVSAVATTAGDPNLVSSDFNLVA